MPVLQRAANTEPRPSSACLPLAGPWRRPTVGPLDFRLAVMTLQTESSRRSTTTHQKRHPRPRHRSQLDANGTDGALDATAERDVARNAAGLALCPSAESQ